MKIHPYVQYFLGLRFHKVLNRQIEVLHKSRARTRDALAYAKAMYGYHQAQVKTLGLDKQGLLEAQLNMLEAQEAIDYSQMLLDYYDLREEQLKVLLADNKPSQESEAPKNIS